MQLRNLVSQCPFRTPFCTPPTASLYLHAYRLERMPCGNTIPLLPRVLTVRTHGTVSHFRGKSGRTPFSLSTLLPFVLTLPSSLTNAALLELLPGDRSHHQEPSHDNRIPKSTPSYENANLFLSLLIHAPIIRMTSVVFIEICSNCFNRIQFASNASSAK